MIENHIENDLDFCLMERLHEVTKTRQVLHLLPIGRVIAAMWSEKADRIVAPVVGKPFARFGVSGGTFCRVKLVNGHEFNAVNPKLL
jgi:hypothetical protein